MSLKPKHLLVMVYPVSGRLIRDPETRQKLALSGEQKPMTSYWLRKIQDEDVSLSPSTQELAPVLEEAPQMSKKKKE